MSIEKLIEENTAAIKALTEAVRESMAQGKAYHTESLAAFKHLSTGGGAVAPASVADAAPKTEKVDYEALRVEVSAYLKEVQKEHGTAVVKAVLAEYKAAKLPDVKDDQLAAFKGALAKAAEAAAAESLE